MRELQQICHLKTMSKLQICLPISTSAHVLQCQDLFTAKTHVQEGGNGTVYMYIIITHPWAILHVSIQKVESEQA